MDASATVPSTALDLDPSLYHLDPDELEFFKVQTGIQDEEELKEHIIAIQAEAWKVFQYRCIRGFGFTKLKISRLPAYPDLQKLGQQRDGAIFLDIGCCFGSDARKAVADGYPMENVIASDLQQEFWDLGHKLFRSTPETFPVPFIAGDVFNPKHITLTPAVDAVPSTPVPSLSSLTSLNPLQGRISAIHVSAFFHLFDEAEQLHVAKALASLLSPEPGSMIFGAHSSQPEKGSRTNFRGKVIFCHPPESWRELWDGKVFRKGSVSVEAGLHKSDRKDLVGSTDPPARVHYHMAWSVKRLY